jgi:hypothetical protein
LGGQGNGLSQKLALRKGLAEERKPSKYRVICGKEKTSESELSGKIGQLKLQADV